MNNAARALISGSSLRSALGTRQTANVMCIAHVQCARQFHTAEIFLKSRHNDNKATDLMFKDPPPPQGQGRRSSTTPTRTQLSGHPLIPRGLKCSDISTLLDATSTCNNEKKLIKTIICFFTRSVISTERY